jgi:membrane protease YdiL (CAAX protease family)
VASKPRTLAGQDRAGLASRAHATGRQAGESAPGVPTPHNGTHMSPPGSVSPRPLPVPIALAVTLVGVLAMVGSGAVAPRLGLGLRAQIAFGTLLLAVPAAGALLLRPSAWPATAGRRLTERAVALSGLLGGALWVASVGLMELQSTVWPPDPAYLELFRGIHRALAPSGPLDAVVSVLVIAALPGLCEELVVRGVLLPSLARSIPGAWAVVVSATLFAAMHLDAYRFAFTFVVGLVFGALRLRSGSLWSSVTAHVALNTLTFLVAPLVDDPNQAYTPQPALGLACLVAGATVAWPLLRALGPSVDSPGTAA